MSVESADLAFRTIESGNPATAVLCAQPRDWINEALDWHEIDPSEQRLKTVELRAGFTGIRCANQATEEFGIAKAGVAKTILGEALHEDASPAFFAAFDGAIEFRLQEGKE